MDVIFIRHGQSEANINGTLIADEFDKLTPLGKKQSEELRHVLESLKLTPKLLFCSPWTRARQTADILFDCDVKMEFDERLAETNPGIFSTWLEKDFNLIYPEFSKDISNRYNGGESHLDMAHRVCNWLVEKIEPYKKQDLTIMAVSHGGPISVAIQYLLNISIEDFYPTFTVPNASISHLRWRADLNRFCALRIGQS